MKIRTSILPLLFLLVAASYCTKDPIRPLGDNGNEGAKPSANWEWFSIDTLLPGFFIFQENSSSQRNSSYLLLGTYRAYMFDSGTGENPGQNGVKIKDVIQDHTDLPVTLLLSHFHFDHNQNVGEFDHIALPDLPYLRARADSSGNFSFTAEELFDGSYPEEIQVSEWLPLNTVLSWGNRDVELINIPGHTDESVALVDHSNKIALLGDFLYNGELFVFDQDDLTPYLQSTDRLLSELDPTYRLFGAHGYPEVPYSKLQTLRDFILCIQGNLCFGSPTSVFGQPVLYYSYQGMGMVIFQ